MTDLVLLQDLGVFEKKGLPMVSSRNIAYVFKKRHDHILRDICRITAPKSGVSKEFIDLNFQRSSFKDSTGRKLPEYLLTRDGFVMLTMGFTGSKAMKFKEDYIKAFNNMATFIKQLTDTRADFPEFTDAILQAYEEPRPYHFSNECDLLNRIVLGVSSKDFKKRMGLDPEESIRPYLNQTQITALRNLQRIDIGLIHAKLSYEQRKTALSEQYTRLQQKQIQGGKL